MPCPPRNRARAEAIQGRPPTHPPTGSNAMGRPRAGRRKPRHRRIAEPEASTTVPRRCRIALRTVAGEARGSGFGRRGDPRDTRAAIKTAVASRACVRRRVGRAIRLSLKLSGIWPSLEVAMPRGNPSSRWCPSSRASATVADARRARSTNDESVKNRVDHGL